MDANDLKLPAIKKDAVVKLSLGTGIISELQVYHLHLIRDKEVLNIITKKLESAVELTPDEQGLVTLSKLLQGIFQAAKDADQIIYKDITDISTE